MSESNLEEAQANDPPPRTNIYSGFNFNSNARSMRRKTRKTLHQTRSFSGFLPTLNEVFNSFAMLKRPGGKIIDDFEDYRKVRIGSIGSTESREIVAPKMNLLRLNNWFDNSKIFEIPSCRVTREDVNTIFQKFKKPMISFPEFYPMIQELSVLKRVSPQVLELRLRLATKPELNSRILHFETAEGTVDRVLDVFRAEVGERSEMFLDLSTDVYEEPVCYGGMRKPGLQNKAKEEEVLRARARQSMMTGSDTSNLNPFQRSFIYHAKNGDYYSDGTRIALLQMVRWMRQAGIAPGSNLTPMDISYLFKRLYEDHGRIYFDDLVQVAQELQLWKKIPTMEVLEKLNSAGEPASASASVISWQVPEIVLQPLTSALEYFSDEYQAQRDKYEPTNADGPHGHTANSRNRHFAHFLNDEPLKVKSTVMAEPKPEQVAVDSRKVPGRNRRSIYGNNADDTFAEEVRNTKDLNAKRWNDAYPFGGMDMSVVPKVDEGFASLFFNTRDKDKVVLELENLAKSKSALNRPTKLSISLHYAFEKVQKAGEDSQPEGMACHQLERWFAAAGVINGPESKIDFTLEDLKQEMRNLGIPSGSFVQYDQMALLVQKIAAQTGRDADQIKEKLGRTSIPSVDAMDEVKSSLSVRKFSRQRRKTLLEKLNSIQLANEIRRSIMP